MKLKKVNVIAGLLGVFLISLGLSSCFAQHIKANGDVVSEERRIGSFEAIEVGGAFEVMLRQGSSVSCVVEADANLMEYIVTRVQGNTLKVYQEKGFKNAELMKLYITFVDLEGIEISGAAEIKGEETFTLDKLHLEASGASEIELKLQLKVLDVNISGASEVELSGSADELKGGFSGASEFEAYGLRAKRARIESSGSADVEISVSDELNIVASGASSVDYKGEPSLTKNVSGAADVDGH
ncbi:MAG: head GIN domain-containing protein [Bacteroidota bacterium]|nr:head GIN domain-containing protein [Bacteroidota bacterium]